MKIFVDENIPFGLESFGIHGEVIGYAGRNLKPSDLTGADALIVRSITKVNANLLAGTPIRFVATATIGTDHVDQAYLIERGIGFSAAPGCNANSVGEYVVAALTRLEVEQGLVLNGKTLGIIGYGHVGKNVAAKAQALGLKIRVCDPPLRDLAGEEIFTFGTYSSLDNLLEESDIISLHVPLVKAGPYPTLGMVNEEFFQKIRRPVVLLNTCRGETIHEPALLNARKRGLIHHLVLDVYSQEPNINRSLCDSATIITPHIAGYSLQGKVNGTVQVYRAFCEFFGYRPEWKPHYPGPANSMIEYPNPPGSEKVSDAAFRHKCISTAYDLLGDEMRLRQSLNDPDPGQSFDNLRKRYPIRHEFAKFIVRGIPEEKRELRSQFALLGFQID